MENSTGSNAIDIPVYLLSFIVFIASDYAIADTTLTLLCKTASLIGFVFIFLNQGRKWFADARKRNKKYDEENEE